MIPEHVMRRIAKAGFRQERHGKCLICGRSFDDCRHDIGQVRALISGAQLQDLIAKELR